MYTNVREKPKQKIILFVLICLSFNNEIVLFKKMCGSALAGGAQWIESVNQRVADWIPSQGTCLGCGPGPQLGSTRGNHTLMFLSFCSSLPFSKIIK